MKITLTEAQLKEIAEELDMGMRCFFYPKTGEIEIYPDLLNPNFSTMDTEPWQETLDKLEENWGDYFEFDKMTSDESFEIMSDFTDLVDNKKLQDRLYRALSKSKPFRNFKWEIDNSGEYRNQWFDFKLQRIIDFVKEQVERQNRYITNE
jgi:hypothetical protein